MELGPAREIDDAVAALRQALRDSHRTDVRELARALDRRIMEPVRHLLGDARQLLVSPDGTLNLIPFEALVDERGAYLLERYSITYLTTGRDLLRMQVPLESKHRPVVFADPLFGEPPSLTHCAVGPDGRERRTAKHHDRSGSFQRLFRTARRRPRRRPKYTIAVSGS